MGAWGGRVRERWLLPSTIVGAAVLLSIPVKLLTEKLSDPDLWWHLRTGKLIVDEKSIPHADVYSFTIPGKSWVVQEWGSEVILQGLRDAFGLYGILAYRAVVTFAIYALVARLLVRRMGSGMATWGLLGLAAYAGSANWTERPNLMSFLLFVVTLTLLERRDKRIWWFLPIAVLWANLHGMVVLGIGLIALVAIAEGIKLVLRQTGADGAWARRLALVSLASIPAILVNPAGAKLISHAFGLLGAVRNTVTEWASPDFHEGSSLLFLALLLILIAAFALNPDAVDLTDLALSTAFLFLALQAVRNLAISAIVLALVVARVLPGALSTLRQRPAAPTTERPSVPLGAMGWAMAIGGLGVLLVVGMPRSGRAADIVDEQFPLAAIERLRIDGVRVFVLDGWSGLVIDRAWPQARVYLDLRGDIYGVGLVNRYRRTISGLPGWDQTLDNACVTHVLIRPKDPLSQVLALTQTWVRLDGDRRSVLFERREPAIGCEQHPIPTLPVVATPAN